MLAADGAGAAGMREGEAVQLVADEIDRDRKQIRLLRTKTNRSRIIAWIRPGGDATSALAAAEPVGLLLPNRNGEASGNSASNVDQVIRTVGEQESEAKRLFQRFWVHDLP